MHNIFEPLATIPGDDSVFDSPVSFHPRGHSSPVNTRQQPVMSSIASSRATAASTYSDRPPLKKTNLRVAVVNCQGVPERKQTSRTYLNTRTRTFSSWPKPSWTPPSDLQNSFRHTTEVPSTDAQTVWGKFELHGGKSTLIGAYYHPPNNHAPDSVNQLGEQLKSLDPEVPIILGGDFNVGDIDWENNTIASLSDRKTLCETLIDVFEDHHIDQIQRECTR